MAYDEMELDMLGDQKTAMFVIISDTDDTFNFIVAIMYTQLFNLLCDRADDVHGGRFIRMQLKPLPVTACAQKSPAQYKLATWYLQDTAFSKR